ncbi:MAG: pyrroline-5-carboxylate reductase [Bryobacteraceae bacterium]|nr:pyrroline-5-carboxylate reductase [Bryobacteraceae bacterium]MCX7603732.1 pyrroline-5-carboxylate reductase [Bryobacteraceae bacterium]
MSEKKRIAVIGAGNMGAAMIGGILKAQVAEPGEVVATTRSAERASEVAERYGIRARAGGNREAAAESDLILLAVKPGVLGTVLEEIRDVLHEGQILISLAAVAPIRLIERLIARRMPVFRAMPNIPVVIEEGATAVSANGVATAEHRALVERIFRAVGVVCFVDEEAMDAVTALSGSGPAYVYMVIEALIAGGLKMGLSHEVATRLAEQTVLGAARLVKETGIHPAILRDQVITPGGVTISAIHELERHGLRAMLISAVETATNHARSRSRALLEQWKTAGD